MDFKRRNGGSFRGGAPQAKRGKPAGEWEDSPSQFEEELSMFDEADMDSEAMEGQAGHDVIPVGEYCTGNQNRRRWNDGTAQVKMELCKWHTDQFHILNNVSAYQ